MHVCFADEEEAHDIDSCTICNEATQQEVHGMSSTSIVLCISLQRILLTLLACPPHVVIDSPPQTKKKKPINYRLAASLLMGDFFHNFADGIFIGTAFTLCDRSVAIAIAAATLYHKLAQELADYFLLTEHCGLAPLKALVLNFLNKLSIVIDVIVILSLDVSNMAIGCILAVSAGVYVHIAASECLPRIEKELKCFKD